MSPRSAACLAARYSWTVRCTKSMRPGTGAKDAAALEQLAQNIVR